MGVKTRSQGKRAATSLGSSTRSRQRRRKLAVVDSKLKSQSADINNESMRPAVLHSLDEDCVEATLRCRPSKRNRSPYVADVFVPSLGREALAHVPNLDMGGKCVRGVKLLVKPQKDKQGNLLGPNAVNPKYGTPKCEFVTQLLWCDESSLNSSYTPTWVGAHPSLGETIAHSLLTRHQQGETQVPGLPAITSFRKQVTISNGTRADFVLKQNDGKQRIVEVKTVVDTDYNSQWDLPARTKCVFQERSQPYRRTAIFPWGQSNQKGPQGERVVSARAIKHVRELASLVEKGSYQATILFVVVRKDAQRFRPNIDACPSFARYLRESHEKGVQILVKRVSSGEGEESGLCSDDEWLDIEWPS